MAKYCSNCGNKVSETSKFCSSCGFAISKEKEELEDKQETIINEPVAENIVAVSKNGKYIPDDDLKKTFFSMKGRLNRLRYFKRIIVLGLFDMFLCMIIETAFYDGELLEILLMFAVLYPQYCLDVRRLHDLDKGNGLALGKLMLGLFSTLFMLMYGFDALVNPTAFAIDGGVLRLMGLIWVVGIGMGLYLLFADGTKGKNKYGPDPLARM